MRTVPSQRCSNGPRHFVVGTITGTLQLGIEKVISLQGSEATYGVTVACGVFCNNFPRVEIPFARDGIATHNHNSLTLATRAPGQTSGSVHLAAFAKIVHVQLGSGIADYLALTNLFGCGDAGTFSRSRC
jgi:hypothetical protein